MRQLAKDYRDFPMYAASQNVINALSSGMPILLLTHFYGIVVAGAYAFGMRILVAPMGLVLSALRQVLFQKAGETQHQGGNLAPLYVKITAGLFAMAFVPSLVLFIWAPQLFTWIFGSQWHTAGEFARFLALWMMFVFCNLPAVLFARLIRIQRAIFIYDLVLLGARGAALMLGGLYLNELQTITLFSLVGAAMNAILIVLVGHAVMKKEGHCNWESIRNSLMGG
jgi:O-antigen/teichoic acid export membrane protein